MIDFDKYPNKATSLVAEKDTCRCGEVIYNTGDGWWHKETGSEYCNQFKDLTAEPRTENNETPMPFDTSLGFGGI